MTSMETSIPEVSDHLSAIFCRPSFWLLSQMLTRILSVLPELLEPPVLALSELLPHPAKSEAAIVETNNKEISFLFINFLLY
jgi:hypothetical protein